MGLTDREKYQDKIKRLAGLVRSSGKVYALTGAGCSTESGLPDFRSPGTGLWEKVDPLKYSTSEVLYNDPESFYKFGFPRFKDLTAAQPNAGHFAMAELEQLGFIKGLITQNIDGLHFKAGSKRIWEVHGHLRTSSCTGCGARRSFQLLIDKLDSGEVPPRCSCRSVLRPDIVLFGDSMSSSYFEAERALQAGCDLLLAAGTSLTVYPVAGLPRFAKQLAIINLQPTPYDREAAILINQKFSAAMVDLVRELKR
ncbi:MAG TPA: NAD-dependent deacylase [Firmicutes bacterium]|nr:NAD-dependent deacylase [Bacillota bacterium]